MQYKKIIFAGIIFLLSASSFFFCKKENQYRAIVTVSMIDAAGGKIPVPSCKLVFGEESFAPDIKRTAYTDANGKYEGEWPREVSLRVSASREINGKIYTGVSIIRLTEGGIAEQEILIKEE